MLSFFGGNSSKFLLFCFFSSYSCNFYFLCCNFRFIFLFCFFCSYSDFLIFYGLLSCNSGQFFLLGFFSSNSGIFFFFGLCCCLFSFYSGYFILGLLNCSISFGLCGICGSLLINHILNRRWFRIDSILFLPWNPKDGCFSVRFIFFGDRLLIPSSQTESSHVVYLYFGILMHSNGFEID